MKRFNQIDIPHPSTFYDANELYQYLKTFKIPPLKIVLSGDGRVGQGAALVLKEHGVKQVSPTEFLLNDYTEAVFCILSFQDYVKPIDSKVTSYDEFFSKPKEFVSTFEPYTKEADVYMPCHFWNPESPIFFSEESMKQADFNIKLVSDISCDVPGPVASTIRTSVHDDPFYDVNPALLKEEKAFSGDKNITVTAVDNLPTALPLNASEAFANDLVENVFPALLGDDKDQIIERATIIKDGKLTQPYKYLDNFLKGS